jgi:stage II sporulation protein D
VLAQAPTSDLTMETVDPNGVLYMPFPDNLPKYKEYRGNMRMIASTNGLETINVLPIEQYLRGVVPAEMPSVWPLEALKAQAVAARTYSWSHLKGDKREYDMLPTAANQVYGGYHHEEASTDLAVFQTMGQVLTYNGNVISALYHACAGGYTENSEYAFVTNAGNPGSVVAYLRGKPDVDPNGVPYDINAASYDFNTGQFTMSQLSAMMALNPATNVGQITNITYSRGVSGRVYKIVLDGIKNGTAVTKTMSGAVFKNTYNKYRLGGPDINSTAFYLTPVPPVTP